tara:strand:+ start:1036 stop:1263 length:228 start_codon:yes stop_codon:yes gene_type:complete
MLYKPAEGDLVAVPRLLAKVPGVKPNSSYGIIVCKKSGSKNIWNILVNGLLLELNPIIVSPLFDLEGAWLQINSQ